MFDRFLVPVDGSALAERAIPYAIALARATHGEITLLHATPEVTSSTGQEAELATAARLDEIVSQIRLQGLRAGTQTLGGDAARAILKAASATPTSMIVMTTHGRGGLGRWLYGSVAEQVLRDADLPILLISATCDYAWPTGRPIKMLIPLDGSITAEAGMESARRLAESLEADAIFLRVVESAQSPELAFDPAHFRLDRPEMDRGLTTAREYLDTLTNQPAPPFTSVDTVVDEGAPASRIAALARQEGVDLIVMATHGRTGPARLVMGSIATATLHRAHVPILIVRPASLREQEEQPSDEATPMVVI